MATSRRIRVGDKVFVRLWPCDAIGEVLEVYGPRQNRHAFVRVALGLDEARVELERSYPLHALRLVEDDAA